MITNFIITAYCACTICCGPRATGLAANGKPPVEGITVAGPRRLPLGTKVWIDGVGNRIVQDRLAKRYDNRFDVYFKRHDDAKRFGIRTLKVRIGQ
jgi:3D (Asp-Asp-Asp) domain-containing protein